MIRSISRHQDGAYRLFSPMEYESYFRLSNTLVYPSEYDILVCMDRVYCEEANKELEAIRERKNDEMKKKAESNRSRRG